MGEEVRASEEQLQQQQQRSEACASAPITATAAEFVPAAAGSTTAQSGAVNAPPKSDGDTSAVVHTDGQDGVRQLSTVAMVREDQRAAVAVAGFVNAGGGEATMTMVEGEGWAGEHGMEHGMDMEAEEQEERERQEEESRQAQSEFVRYVRCVRPEAKGTGGEGGSGLYLEEVKSQSWL